MSSAASYDRPIRRTLAALAVVATLGPFAGCSSSAGSGASASTTTGATGPAPPTTTEPFGERATLTGEQRLSPLWAQGVAHVPGGWIFSGTNGLWRTDSALNVVKVVAPAIPDAWKARGFDHIGDIDVVGPYVYAPFEQPDYTKGYQATARYDRVTLEFVDAVMLPQHQNSFVTVDPGTMTAYTMDEFDGNALLRYDVAHNWKPLAPLRMSKYLHHTQGADIDHGAIWISTDDGHHGIYRVDIATGATVRVSAMGHAHGEGEGIDATDLAAGFLHAMCVDKSLVPVWFEHFRAAAR